MNAKGKQTQRSQAQFRLKIPLDASGIEDFKPEQAIKVLVQARDGSHQTETVKLSAKGKGTATFSFRKRPGALRIVLGPDSASDEELLGMQTISFDVSARRWLDEPELTLPPIRIPPFYWHWWLIWCRTFTIRGRVLCPDGRPVPGARVCAYDVDMWWWWSSKQLVGCDMTDATGAFEITFRWCCGWWPWWWWRHRVWQLEPVLADRILPMLQREPKLRKIPLPDPVPDLTIFEDLLVEDDVSAPLPLVPMKLETLAPTAQEMQEMASLPKARFDHGVLDKLRDRLIERLPVAPELEPLHLWPWWPWHPWWDCTPDIIFQVTQSCLGVETVIVDESVWDTRWNIPTTLNVTLVASDEACCIEPQDDPVGVCMVITHACDDPVQFIGGNPTAPATPAGYRNPGMVSIYGDRPFAGVVPILGLFGDLAGVDYYEFEWSDDGGATWNAMPPAAASGFLRRYWGPALGGGPVGFHPVTFTFTDISGRRVIQSREYFEANNAPASWGLTRFWTSGRDYLMRWITQNVFADGTYHLRVKSWDLDAGGNLINPRILPLCNTTDDNGIVLTIDNRLVGGGPTCPNGHVCGPGTVHTCTVEPDTDILAVKILHADGTTTDIGACGTAPIGDQDMLQVDFLAHDPDGHLSYYTLRATYGENLAVNLLSPGLLSHPATVFTASPVIAPVPPAAQVGPYYGHTNPALSALDQGAVAPIWHGGAIRLQVPAAEVFPETCCYQLELRAHKRTIVSCNDSLWSHKNYSEYSFMIIV